jgi:hypothetical protein
MTSAIRKAFARRLACRCVEGSPIRSEPSCVSTIWPDRQIRAPLPMPIGGLDLPGDFRTS